MHPRSTSLPISEEFTFVEDKPKRKVVEVTLAPVVPPKKLYPELGRTTKWPPITNIEEYLQQEKFKFEVRLSSNNQEEVADEDEFEYIRFLGKGAYGSVSMVRKLDTGVYYARKEIGKQFVTISNKINEVKNEKNILKSIRFPFTINLKHFYQDHSKVYLLLPIMSGGDLYHHFKKLGKFHENSAKFILAQLALAIEYLHVLNIIHRDIKLENILLDHVGYIKLSDFGMCKLLDNNGRTYTMCGTAEYMAPEVINNKGYGLPADWWSFGVLTYEMCCGQSPFAASEFLQIFYLITHCKYDVPSSFSYSLSNLIENLLQEDLSKRFGNLKNGVNDIKSHEWFKRIKWLDLINRRIPSPLLFLNPQPSKNYYDDEHQPPIMYDSFTNLKYDKFFQDF